MSTQIENPRFCIFPIKITFFEFPKPSGVVIEGKAAAYVDGQRYPLGKFDTTFVPPLVPHCFVNESDEELVFIYFYPEINVRRDPVDESGPGKKTM